MNTQTTLKTLEVQLQHSIARSVSELEFLHTHREKLERLNLRFSGYSSYIDFDNLSRPDLLKVLRTFGGKWDKTPGYNGGLTYTRNEQINGLTLRCYNGEPPPSCRIVETVKWVKVPAKREKVVTRTVVCTGNH